MGSTMGDKSTVDALLKALQKAAGDHQVRSGIFFGSTDSRFVRRWHKLSGGKPIKAIGFSPMCNTRVLLHDHDEFLNRNIFLTGIEVFKNYIGEIANFEDL